jgi:hypothetical protein
LNGKPECSMVQVDLYAGTEAIMLAYGFKTELLVELVNAGLATASIEGTVAGTRRIEVTRMRITAAGRRTSRTTKSPSSEVWRKNPAPSPEISLTSATTAWRRKAISSAPRNPRACKGALRIFEKHRGLILDELERQPSE